MTVPGKRVRSQPLSPADTAWWRMEERNNHFVVNSLLFFESRLDAERVKRLLADRLADFPRFQQVIVEPRFGLPAWRDDPEFDIDSHVHVVGLPEGGKESLEALVGDLTSEALDPGRPLWKLYLIAGPGPGTTILSRIHHAVGDGMALMSVLLALTDTDRGRHRNGSRDGVGGRRLTGLLRESARLATDPVRLLGAASYLAESAYVLARLTLLPPEPVSVLHGPLGGRKKVAWSEPMPVSTLKRIGHANDATVNDVLLAAVAGSLRHYARRARKPLPKFRVTVPYNLRPLDEAGELGNGFTLVYLDLPVDEADPHRRLQRVRHAMRHIKASPEPWVTFAVLNSVGLLPPPLQKLAIRFFGSKASAVVTNVPGPAEKIHLAGEPVRHALFWEPESAGIGLGVSIFSYAGEVVVGVIADARLVPDPHLIVDQVAREVELLKPAPAARRAAPVERSPRARSRPAVA